MHRHGSTQPEKQAVHPTTRRLLAAAVVAQPLFIAVNALFHPPVDITGPGLLAGAVAGPTAWFAIHVVAALGALLGGPAAVGLRTLAGPPTRLASAGVVVTFVGSAVLSLSFATEASVLRLAATALDHADAVALAEAYTRTPEFFAIPVGVLAGWPHGLRGDRGRVGGDGRPHRRRPRARSDADTRACSAVTPAGRGAPGHSA